MVKGKRIRYELAYSNTPLFNKRQYNIGVYTNNFNCIVRVVCEKEIEEAKKRVKLNKKNGHYIYIPSKEYTHALSKFHIKNQTHVKAKQITGLR